MIDLHCHLLPGVDDGALDLDDSVAMARVAAADGVEAICATPHIRHDHDVRIGEIAGRAAALREELARRGVPLRVLPGGEVAETAVEALDDRELDLVSLGGGRRWILLEPKGGPLSDSLTAAVEHLAARGRRALVAHPERHLAEDLMPRLCELVARGALVQATAAFFEDGAVAEGMLELAGAGLVHVLASDAHSSHGGRSTRLSGGIARLAGASRVAPHVDWIAREAPRAIVAGEDVEPPYAAG